METTPARIQFQSKSYLGITILIITGLLFLISSIHMQEGFWASLFSQLSTALLVGGLWTGIYELSMRRDFLRINDENRDILFSKLCLQEGQEKMGLAEVYEKSSDYDYNFQLESCQNLTVLLNDGRTWVSNHSESLQRRFKDTNKQTTIFLLHPDSDMLDILARKVGSTKAKLKEKIFETVGMLNHLMGKNNNNGSITIYGHHLYNPHSVFRCDSTVILTPYFAARSRSIVPLFIFKDIGSSCYAA